MYDAFISYSGTDTVWAEKLYHRLRRFRIQNRPLNLFFAPANITAGQSIPKSLSLALRDCDHLIAVVTPAWLTSEWCTLEHEATLWMDPAAAQGRLIPLLLQDTDLPPVLHRLKYLDVRKPEAFEPALRQIVAAIRSHAARKAQEAADHHEKERILHTALLPWMGRSGPSFDFIWPEMFVDPPIGLQRHPAPALRLSEWLDADRNTGRRTYAVLGEAGAGKSTALRSILLNGGARLPAGRVLVHARDIDERRDTLVRRARESQRDGFAVLVDGLDEAGAASFSEVAGVLRDLSQADATLVIASRSDFFERHFAGLRDDELALHEVLEMKAWDVDDILDFSRKYSDRLGDPAPARSVHEIIGAIPGADRMISNPMRLTLLLYLLAVGATIDATSLREPFVLYRLFYDEWIKKERQRRTTLLDYAVVRHAHTTLARWLYEHRGSTGLDPAEIFGRGPADLPSATELLADSAFADLLTVQDDAAGQPRVLSFRHETIGEFLIAHDILNAFRAGGREIDTSLRLTVGDDVNRFVRSGMNDLSASAVGTVLDNLTQRYHELLSVDTGEPTDTADRIREQILYYVGRLPLPGCPQLLPEAYANETSPLNRRSAALGAIVQGDAAVEADYMARLDDPAEDLLNRSVQLVYFGDVRADLHTYVDAGGDWSRVRDAIYARFPSDAPRNQRLRWWDLRTLRAFYRSRNHTDAVSEQEARLLRDLAGRIGDGSTRNQAIGRELAALMDDLGVSVPEGG